MSQAQPSATPLPVRACIGALGLAAGSALIYGVTRAIQAVIPEHSPYPVVDSATDAAFALFAIIGYGAAAYGMRRRRWGARQLGLVVSAAFLPYGVLVACLAYANLLAYEWADPQRVFLLAANCLAITGAMLSAALALATLPRRTVAAYLAAAVPPITEDRVHRMILRARVLLVTVTLAVVTTVLWLTMMAVTGMHYTESTQTDRNAAALLVIVLFVPMFAPGPLAAIAAALLPRYNAARRAGLVGLWIYALAGVPVLLLTATFLTTDSGTMNIADTVWKLGTAVTMLCELVAYCCVVGGVLLLNHPAMRYWLTIPRTPAPA